MNYAHECPECGQSFVTTRPAHACEQDGTVCVSEPIVNKQNMLRLLGLTPEVLLDLRRIVEASRVEQARVLSRAKESGEDFRENRELARMVGQAEKEVRAKARMVEHLSRLINNPNEEV